MVGGKNCFFALWLSCGAALLQEEGREGRSCFVESGKIVLLGDREGVTALFG